MNEESRKAGLKPNIQKAKIIASCPISLWEIDGEKIKTVKGFIFLDSKITVDDDCRHEIKRHFLLGRKTVKNLGKVLKSRDIILSTKICRVKIMVFPVVMYRCES